MRNTFRVAVPLTALLSSAVLAQSASRMDQIVQSYVADHTFMGAVLVARGPDVLFSKAYGFANAEWQIPNTIESKFRLGSVTKQFTAASILLLEERGKLSVNDPVKKYLPDMPAAWDKITIYHLLTHTSGIPNFTSFPDYEKFSTSATTADQVIARFKDKELDFEPGSHMSYSNSGYVVLTAVVEHVSGMKYAEFLRQNIFAPLGMTNSGYDVNAEVIPNRAAGYTYVNGQLRNSGYVDMTVPQGAGALYSTTGDLLTWERGLFGGKMLQPASVQKMTTPFKNDYAFGLVVDSLHGHKHIWHNGGISGFNTDLDYYPTDQTVVVVLSNVNTGATGAIANRLAAVARGETVVLASERRAIPLDAAGLQRVVGGYRHESGFVMLVTLEGGQLSARLGAQPAVPIYPESPAIFFAKGEDAQYEFGTNDAQGRPMQLVVHQNDNDNVHTRVSDAEFKTLADAAPAMAARFKSQTAAPGSEAALRRLLETMRSDAPDYSIMTDAQAARARAQVAMPRAILLKMGALKSLTFRAVGQAGPDIYTGTFEHGVLELRIWLATDGKIAQSNYRDVTPP